jgi:nickel/cobalt transporter (NiCoT) family protein
MRSLHTEFRFTPVSAGINVRTRIIILAMVLVSLNVLAWLCAVLSFQTFPLLLGTALLAYTFGLRHAVDADHIAAIDNVTRKLMQQGQRPVGVGLFFSLGHSTVVFGLSMAFAATSVTLKDNSFQNVAGVIGTSVSGFFLLGIAAINFLILIAILRTFESVKRGNPSAEEDLDSILARRGLMGRIFRALFRLINHSWQMYLVGFLFGLGFETATEVGLLGISATQAFRGLPIWFILILPALFTAGMCLADSIDNLLMLGAYGWAFIKPIRNLYYNLAMTFISAVVALIMGGIEILGLIRDQLKMQGTFWDAVAALNDKSGMLGFIIIGVFVVSWVTSILIYRLNRFDEIEVDTVPEVRESQQAN